VNQRHSPGRPALGRALETANAADVQVLDMAQGQKKSRILAWTFARR